MTRRPNPLSKKGGPQAAAAEPRGNDRPRLGRRRRGLRLRRRLRRPSQFRDGLVGESARGRGLSHGDSQPARLALVRAVAHVRQAAAVLRRQRRQHGLDAQPLHGQPQGPQRRRLQPDGEIGRRPDRATLAYCQRAREAYPGGRLSPGASRRASAVWPITTIGATASDAPIILDAKADLVVYGMGERPLLEIVARLAAGESIQAIRDVRGTVYRLGAAEAAAATAEFNAASRRANVLFVLPSYEEVAADKQAFVAMTRLIHRRDEPRQRPAAGAVPWPRGGGGQSAGLALDRGGDGPRVRPAVHPPPAPRLRPPTNSRLRGGEGLDPDRSRLFRRLHFLLADRAPGAGSFRAAAGSRCWRKFAAWPATRISPASSATSAARRRTCTR